MIGHINTNNPDLKGSIYQSRQFFVRHLFLISLRKAAQVLRFAGGRGGLVCGTVSETHPPGKQLPGRSETYQTQSLSLNGWLITPLSVLLTCEVSVSRHPHSGCFHIQKTWRKSSEASLYFLFFLFLFFLAPGCYDLSL